MIPLQTSLATFKADFSLFMCSLAQYIGTPRKPKPLKILTSQHGPKQAKQPLKLINLVIFVNFTTELNSLKFARNGTARPVIRSYLMTIVWGRFNAQKNHSSECTTITSSRLPELNTEGDESKKNTHPFKKQGHAKPNKILHFHSSGFCKIHVHPKKPHMWRNP